MGPIMKIPFKEARLRPLIGGYLKYSGMFRLLFRHTATTEISSRYYYAVWMRHLHYISKFYYLKTPFKILEIGPGDSLGVGLAALFSGANCYYGIDIINYLNCQLNLKIFDELVALFKSRTCIPDEKEFPVLRPIVNNYGFPQDILTDDLLEFTMNKERLESIRLELINPFNVNNKYIRVFIPWSKNTLIESNSIDIIMSQAALQSVQGLDNIYEAMKLWIKPGGLMSHTIDFGSIGYSKRWNGNWTFSDWEWKVIVGLRKYAVNREPYSKYLAMNKKYKMKLLIDIPMEQKNELSDLQIARKFKYLSRTDLSVANAYILSQQL